MKKTAVRKMAIPKNPSILLLGIPGPGLVGTMSLTYIIHSLKMEFVGEIESSPSSVVFIDNGQLIGPVRIYKKERMFAILSDVPIDYDLAPGFTDSVIDFAQKNDVDIIMFLSGIHVHEKNISNLKTYGLVTNEKLDEILYKNDIPKFLTGIISGPDATILTYLKNSSIPCIILHTECNYFFPDPDSAMQMIKTLSHILNVRIDLTEFKKQIDFLKLQNRQLMAETLGVMQQQKEQSTRPPQIYK